MKDQLLEVYKKRHADFKTVRSAFAEDDLAGPFLMSPSADYAKQPFPLLIIGQETAGWAYHLDDLPKQMRHYEQFNVGEEYYASPFWNITRKVEEALGNEPYTCAWTNVSKYDVDGGRAYGAHAETISGLDNILRDEIEILKPKVCLFFTGVDFDDRLEKIFPGLEWQEVKEHSHPERLWKMRHPSIPVLSFRSDHPKYLRISGQEKSFVDFIGRLAK